MTKILSLIFEKNIPKSCYIDIYNLSVNSITYCI